MEREPDNEDGKVPMVIVVVDDTRLGIDPSFVREALELMAARGRLNPTEEEFDIDSELDF